MGVGRREERPPWSEDDTSLSQNRESEQGGQFLLEGPLACWFWLPCCQYLLMSS